MSGGEILLTVILGVLSIEISDVAGWLARKIAAWAATLRYRSQPERAAVRAQEWISVIEERPGNLFKLATALWFASGAVAARSAEAIRRGRHQPVPFFGPVQTETLPLVLMGPAVGVWIGRESVALGVVMGIASCVVTVFGYVFVRNSTLRRSLPALVATNMMSEAEAEAVLAWFPTQFWRMAVRWKAPREVRWSVSVMKHSLLSAATDNVDLWRFSKLRDDPAVISFNKRIGRQLQEKLDVARTCLSTIEALTQPES